MIAQGMTGQQIDAARFGYNYAFEHGVAVEAYGDVLWREGYASICD